METKADILRTLKGSKRFLKNRSLNLVIFIEWKWKTPTGDDTRYLVSSIFRGLLPYFISLHISCIVSIFFHLRLLRWVQWCNLGTKLPCNGVIWVQSYVVMVQFALIKTVNREFSHRWWYYNLRAVFAFITSVLREDREPFQEGHQLLVEVTTLMLTLFGWYSV